MAQTNLQGYFAQALTARNPIDRIALNHIGVQIQQQNGDYYIAAVLDGYPAQKAGLERGDIIRRVNGNNYHPIKAFNSLNSTANTEHNLYIERSQEYRIEAERDGKIITVNCTPVYENLFDAYRSASEASVQQLPAGNKVIAYVHFWTLSKSTHDLLHFHNIMDRIAQSDGLVLDLRSSQGYLSLQHVDAFFPSRSSYNPKLTSRFSQSAPDTHNTGSRHRYYGKPIAVLHNQATRGEIEHLIQQLATLDRVVTIGTNTSDLNLPPQILIPYPLTQHSPSDPHFEAALSALLGNL